MRGWGRWILLFAMVGWIVEQELNIDIWQYFGIFVAVYFIFGRDIRRLFENISGRLTETTDKRQHHVYEDVEPQEFGNEDGLNRRIIRASDGEFLVAVEDPETGALYLEENR